MSYQAVLLPKWFSYHSYAFWTMPNTLSWYGKLFYDSEVRYFINQMHINKAIEWPQSSEYFEDKALLCWLVLRPQMVGVPAPLAFWSTVNVSWQAPVESTVNAATSNPVPARMSKEWKSSLRVQTSEINEYIHSLMINAIWFGY